MLKLEGTQEKPLAAGEAGSWRPSPEWRAFILKLVEAFAEVCLVALVCFGSITSVFLLDFSLQDIYRMLLCILKLDWGDSG